MPITQSAKKALRQDKRRNKINAKRKKRLKTTLKKFEDLVEKGEIKEAKDFLPQVYKVLDKSAKTGIIKKNTASRKKSRLTKMLERES